MLWKVTGRVGWVTGRSELLPAAFGTQEVDMGSVETNFGWRGVDCNLKGMKMDEV